MRPLSSSSAPLQLAPGSIGRNNKTRERERERERSVRSTYEEEEEWVVERLRSRRSRTRQTGRSLTPREEMVSSRKLKNLLFFVTLRSLSSCSPAPGNSMSTPAPTLRMTKKMIDQYQRTLGVDIWSTHYEKMQENLNRLKEINNKLRREIRHRTGEDMSGLNLQELCHLQENISDSLAEIRERKVKNLEEQHGNLVLDLEAKCEDPKYDVVENEGHFNSAVAFANGVHNLYAFRLQSLHPNLQNEGGFGYRDLRLS